MKICPFLKLLRSEVSNRPRIFRCWINDPYTFQNRCTSWREAISNFGNFLNTGILLLDAIGLQRSFPETCRACDPLPCFSILTNCACILMMLLGPLPSSSVIHFEFLASPTSTSFSILRFFTNKSQTLNIGPVPPPNISLQKAQGPEDTCSTSAAMVVPSTPLGLLLQRHQDPLREPFQKTPPTVTKLLLAALDGRSWHPLHFNSWSRCVYQRNCFFVLHELVLNKAKQSKIMIIRSVNWFRHAIRTATSPGINSFSLHDAFIDNLTFAMIFFAVLKYPNHLLVGFHVPLRPATTRGPATRHFAVLGRLRGEASTYVSRVNISRDVFSWKTFKSLSISEE